jgi:hypothetical protein
MKNSVLWLGPALLLTAGCTEILNIDIHYLSGGGGNGAGTPSDGGNAAGAPSDGGNGASTADGGSGTGGIMGTGGDASGGAPPSLCTFTEEFEVEPNKTSCWTEIGAEHATVLAADGDYNIVPHRTGSQVPPGHGWYNDDQGYLLHRSVQPGPFAVVTRVRATAVATEGPPNPTGTYHMAGLILRDTNGGGPNNESWAKFEVGYRQSNLDQPTPEPDLNLPIGVLAAVTRGEQTIHLKSYEDNNAHVVDLGVCRDSFGLLYFFHRPDGGAFQLQEDQAPELPTFQLVDEIDIGLTAGAFNGSAVSVKGRFEFIRFAEGGTISDDEACQAILENLVAAGPDPSCECP